MFGVALRSGALLMVVAGISWGIYSLLGRQVADPLEATANNFIFCVPLVLAVSLFFFSGFHATSEGVWIVLAQRARTD